MANENIIDNLSIQIKASAADANQVLDGLERRLGKLSGTLKDLSGKKVNIGVTAETVEVLRKFANAIEEIKYDKLNAFANLTQQIQKINLGLKPEDGNSLSMFAMGLEDLDIDKFRSFAEISQDVHSISMGIGEPTANAFATFVDAINRLEETKLRAFTDSFQGFAGVSIGFGDAGAKAFGDVMTSINSMSVGNVLTLTNAFRDFSGINLGLTANSVNALFKLNDAVFLLDVDKLREMTQLDFSNFVQLANAAPDLRGLATILYALQKIADKAAQAEEKLAEATKDVGKETKTTTKSVSKHVGALGNLFNSIKRIAFYRLIRSAIKSFTQGLSEGIENLYYWSQQVGTSFAPAMDRLATATLYLKNGFASMWSPLIERAIPAIDATIDRLVDMFNFVQEMFARMTGQATWNKALKYPVSYKDALDEAAGSAKALQNILMDFDEINAINTPKSGSRGSGADEKDYAAMFKLMETSTDSPLGVFGEIVEDIRGKVSDAFGTVKEFADFFLGLDFQPITDSTSAFWDVVSPILDELNDDAEWLEENVFEPVTEFLVEKGIPATIDTLSTAISSLWDAFEPLKDGLKNFWDENGEWIMKVVGDAFLNALGNIKDAFKKIGEFFSKNKNIESILSNISKLAKTLGESEFFKWLLEFIQTAAFDSFLTSINTTLEALEPVLSIVAGVLDIITSIFTVQYKGEHQAVEGLKKICSGIFDLIISPIKLVMYLVADLMDLIATLFPRRKQEMQDMAQEIRNAADNMGIFGEATRLTSKDIEDLSPQPINNVQEASKYARDTLAQMGDAAKTSFQQSTEWAQYCTKWGLDPMTGAILNVERDINGLPKTAQKGFSDTTGYGKQSAKDLTTAFTSALSPNAAFSLGKQFGESIQNGVNAPGVGGSIGAQIAASIQAALSAHGAVYIPVEAQFTNANYNQLVNMTKQQLRGMGISITGFATGGYPVPGSLFYAGENNTAEILGTIGGRTAVAGGEEITGIREAVYESGQRQETLLRSLISAVQNKDLTLVANSSTGRWVNKALKAYSGVTG